MDQPVDVRRDGEIAIVAVNVPEKRNAMDVDTRKELRAALEAQEEDDDVQAIILTGGGDTYIAGSDVSLFLEMNPFDAQDYTEYTQGLYNYVESISKPVVAAIEGYAMGGGLEISMCCDLRVSTEDAMLGQTELAIGAIPGGGGTQRLTRMVGVGVAKEMMFTGQPITADRAHQLGLVNRVVPEEDLLEEAKELAGQMTQHSPLVFRILKEVVDEGQKTDLSAGLEMERLAWSLVFASEDVDEGVEAFLEKRDAEYEGGWKGDT